MNPTELKETLVKQYNEMAANLQRLEGAIAACDKMLEETTEEPTADEQADD